MPRIEFEGRAVSADRFTAMLWTGLGLFGVHLSKRRGAKKKEKQGKRGIYIVFRKYISHETVPTLASRGRSGDFGCFLPSVFDQTRLGAIPPGRSYFRGDHLSASVFRWSTAGEPRLTASNEYLPRRHYCRHVSS